MQIGLVGFETIMASLCDATIDNTHAKAQIPSFCCSKFHQKDGIPVHLWTMPICYRLAFMCC